MTLRFLPKRPLLQKFCECRDIRPRVSGSGTSHRHGNKARRGPLTAGQPDLASIASTASSAPKHHSGNLPSTTKPLRSRRTSDDRTTTSPKTSPIVVSSGLSARRRRLLTAPGSAISRLQLFMPRIMLRQSGSIASPDNSTAAGIHYEKKSTNVNSHSESSRRERRTPLDQSKFRHGRTTRSVIGRSQHGSWNASLASLRTPITTSVESSMPRGNSMSATEPKRSSSISPAITEPQPREPFMVRGVHHRSRTGFMKILNGFLNISMTSVPLSVKTISMSVGLGRWIHPFNG